MARKKYMTTKALGEAVIKSISEMSPEEKADVRRFLLEKTPMTPASARKILVKFMERYGFTPAMCADKSNNMLLNIAHITSQHRNYLGHLDPDELISLGEIERIVAEQKQVN